MRLEAEGAFPHPTMRTSVYVDTLKQLGVQVERAEDEADDRLMELVRSPAAHRHPRTDSRLGAAAR
jgi:hypothetical protein